MNMPKAYQNHRAIIVVINKIVDVFPNISGTDAVF